MAQHSRSDRVTANPGSRSPERSAATLFWPYQTTHRRQDLSISKKRARLRGVSVSTAIEDSSRALGNVPRRYWLVERGTWMHKAGEMSDLQCLEFDVGQYSVLQRYLLGDYDRVWSTMYQRLAL